MEVLKQRVSGDDLEFLYIRDFYDEPLGGLAYYNGELVDFSGIYGTYTIYRLTFKEKVRALYRKKLFEICVGYHWTYKNGERNSHFYMRRPKWFFKILFKLYYYNKYKRIKDR